MSVIDFKNAVSLCRELKISMKTYETLMNTGFVITRGPEPVRCNDGHLIDRTSKARIYYNGNEITDSILELISGLDIPNVD